MNIKLKQIELEAFRAYKEKQVFDFTDNNGFIANLVVIFAPNGFGKTSFLDAVEWGMNKEINRFSNNEVLKKTTKLEKGIILKNRDSVNANGVVKFTDNNNQTLLLNTKVTGRIHRTDYNEGIEVESSSDLKFVREKSLARDNILSHDKIDSFLLFSSGKDRYEALAEFWDYSNDTGNYKAIYLLWNEVKKEIANKNKILKNLAKQIKEISLPIEDLNLHIEKVNGLSVGRFEKLKGVPSQSQLDLLSQKCVYFISIVITDIREIQNKALEFEQLIETLPQYDKISKLYSKSKERIEELQKQINQFILEEKLLAKEKLINEDKSNINKRLEYLNTLKEKRKFFLKANNDISINRNYIDQNNKKINELKRVNNEIASKYTLIESTNEQEEKRCKKLISEKERFTEEYKQYKTLTQQRLRLRKRIIRLQKLINKRMNKLEKVQSEIIELKHILNLNYSSLINYDFSEKSYNKDISYLHDIDYSLELLKEKRNKKHQEYLKFGKLNKDLNEIIKIGKQVIESSESSECPLCSTSFPNFEELIIKVDRNIKDNFQFNEIYNEVKVLDSKIKEKESIREDILFGLKTKIEIELRNLEETNKTESQKLERINIINKKKALCK